VVADPPRLRKVVRDEHEGQVGVRRQLCEQVLDDLAGRGVQRGRRLVEEQHLGFVGEGARQ
jgi:hypothetical protein